MQVILPERTPLADTVGLVEDEIKDSCGLIIITLYAPDSMAYGLYRLKSIILTGRNLP